MSDKLVKLKIAANNMTQICWVLLVTPVLLYVLVNIIHSGIGESWNNFIGVQSLSFISTLIIVYILHEALHILAGLIVGVKLSSFSFGFDKTSLSIECGCHQEMSIKTYQFMLLLPLLVLTPLLTGLVYTSDANLWGLMLALSTSGCAFDLTVFIGLIGVPGQVKIIPELEGKNGYVYVRAAS